MFVLHEPVHNLLQLLGLDLPVLPDQVRLEVRPPGEALPTDWAGELSLGTEEQPVDGESSGLTEASATGTLVGPLAGVGHHVVPQMILSLETFLTLLAAVGPLPSVNSLVNVPVVGLAEVLGTIFTKISPLLLPSQLLGCPHVIVFDHVLVEPHGADSLQMIEVNVGGESVVHPSCG